jgi:hypothetical protein
MVGARFGIAFKLAISLVEFSAGERVLVSIRCEESGRLRRSTGKRSCKASGQPKAIERTDTALSAVRRSSPEFCVRKPRIAETSMEVMQLTSAPLADKALEVLAGLEAHVRRGPLGPEDEQHDLEVTFPGAFLRHVDSDYVARIDISKKFVVEVKSDLRGGAGLSHVRQLHDWVLRETKRIVPAEVQDSYLFALEQAKLDVDFHPLRSAVFNFTQGEIEDAHSAMESLVEAVDLALANLMFRVKGLLVVNHHAAVAENKRARIIASNALSFAKANHLAVITWQTLLNVAESAKTGIIDPLNFWCQLFETDGVFEPLDYDWKRESTFSM